MAKDVIHLSEAEAVIHAAKPARRSISDTINALHFGPPSSQFRPAFARTVLAGVTWLALNLWQYLPGRVVRLVRGFDVAFGNHVLKEKP